MIWYGKGYTGMDGQELYVRFYTKGHEDLMNLEIQMIDVTDVSRPNERKVFR